MPTTLPPGVDDGAFHAALDKFRGVTGAGHVITDEPGLAGYRDPYPVLEPGHFAASAAVRPGSVDEIRQIVLAASEHGVPLAPVSGGRNLGYGGAAPRLTGAVVLDLKRLNRIIEINDTFGYALVEPGVTYFDLHKALLKRGSRFWLDVPDLGWGSVIGNTLERGVGYTPYGDHLSIQCGMEVVLANGDVIRTGMGGLPGSNTWQLYKYGYGPYLDPLFTQSNFGIVTKMGVWLMPEPGGYQAYMVTLPREDDLEQMVEILRPLRMSQQIQNVPTLRSLLLDAAACGSRKAYYDGPGPVPDSVASRIMADLGIGMWNFYGAVYGPEQARAAALDAARAAFGQIPGARFYTDGEHDSPVLAARTQIMAGKPNLETINVLQWVANGGHVDFAPVSPATGRDAMQQYLMVRERCREFGQDYMSTFIVGRREMHHICLMMFDSRDPDDRKRTRELCGTLIEDAASAGYGEYRVHPAFMDQVAATFSYGDHALLRLNERIKDALDPAGILAPGKQGIWPRRFRESGLSHS